MAVKQDEQVAERDPRIYPCRLCPTMRTKAEGGTVFTVCDACWEKLHDGKEVVTHAK